jgi:hypothetical protein
VHVPIGARLDCNTARYASVAFRHFFDAKACLILGVVDVHLRKSPTHDREREREREAERESKIEKDILSVAFSKACRCSIIGVFWHNGCLPKRVYMNSEANAH